jgi:translation initiation factor IF-3
MDYGKYKYEQSKKERELRKNQKVTSIKEVQLSATIEENDIQTKAKAAQRFLAGGDKVKVSIRFRGRQITHQEIGLAVMQDFAKRFEDIAVVERKPLVEGRHMIMILAPKSDKPAPKSSAKGA